MRNNEDFIVMIFDAGRVVERGTHEELARKRGRYWELLQYQRSHPLDDEDVDEERGDGVGRGAREGKVGGKEENDVVIEGLEVMKRNNIVTNGVQTNIID